MSRQSSAKSSRATSANTKSVEITKLDFTIEEVPCRFYTPNKNLRNESKFPLMIYFHGGAYVLPFELDNYDTELSLIAKKANIEVCSLNYPLAWAKDFPGAELPFSIEECMKVVVQLMETQDEVTFDKSKIILAGDSAGGNIAANIIQRLALSDRKPLPVLQILIYPQMQYFNFKTPSSHHYSNLPEKASNPDPAQNDWDFKSYLQTVGIGNVVEEPSQFDPEIVQALKNNDHTALVNFVDPSGKLRTHLENNLDLKYIPHKYKQGKSYYKPYENENMVKGMYPAKLKPDNILLKNEDYAKRVGLLCRADISAGLADDSLLKKLPPAYIIVVEHDELKDEALIYSERLKLNGIDVHVAYYDEEGMEHGCFNISGEDQDADNRARKLINDLAMFINSKF